MGERCYSENLLENFSRRSSLRQENVTNRENSRLEIYNKRTEYYAGYHRECMKTIL